MEWKWKKRIVEDYKTLRMGKWEIGDYEVEGVKITDSGSSWWIEGVK